MFSTERIISSFMFSSHQLAVYRENHRLLTSTRELGGMLETVENLVRLNTFEVEVSLTS
jgi:hypothetical protein